MNNAAAIKAIGYINYYYYVDLNRYIDGIITAFIREKILKEEDEIPFGLLLIGILLSGAYNYYDSQEILSQYDENIILNPCTNIDSLLFKGIMSVPVNQHINSLTNREYLPKLPRLPFLPQEYGTLSALGSLDGCDANAEAPIYEYPTNIYAAAVILVDIMHFKGIISLDNMNDIFVMLDYYLDYTGVLQGKAKLLEYAEELILLWGESEAPEIPETNETLAPRIEEILPLPKSSTLPSIPNIPELPARPMLVPELPEYPIAYHEIKKPKKESNGIMYLGIALGIFLFLLLEERK